MKSILLLNLVPLAIAQITAPYPLYDSLTVGSEAWTALFLNGATIPNIPPKPTTAPSDLTRDPRFCTVGSRQWALTFDDGPGAFSAQSRDYLKANNLPSSFYVIGRQIPAYSAYMKSVADDPLFEVSMHTWSHRYLFNLTNTEIVGEIVWSAKAIYDATGKVPRYLRPPFGSIDDRVRAIMFAMDVVPVMWQVDSQDWQLNSVPPRLTTQAVSEIWRTALIAPHPNGVISLQHDFFEASIQVGQMMLLPAFMNSGYTPTLVSECLAGQGVGGPYATSGKLFELITGRKGSDSDTRSGNRNRGTAASGGEKQGVYWISFIVSILIICM